MADNESSQTDALIEHYNALLAKYGTSIDALGWRNTDVQSRNFSAITQVFEHETQPFSVYEVGSGLGDFADFLGDRMPHAEYFGSDIVTEMITRSRERNPKLNVEVRDVIASPPADVDYVVESGIFNLCMSHSSEDWWQFVQRMLRAMFSFARKGIAANFLTSHVDWTRELGYYQDPARLFDFAVKELSRFAEIRHAYYPWEFTLLVYRTPQPLRYGPPPVQWPPESRERPDGRHF